MKEKNTKKISVGSALLIAVMSLGSFSAFSSLTGKNLSSFVPTVFADDNNDEEQGKDEPNKDEDENKNELDNKQDEPKSSEKNKREKMKEEVKKRVELRKEAEKREIRKEIRKEDKWSRTQDEETDADGDNDGDGSVDTDGDTQDRERVGDTKGMYKDSTKTMEKLTERLNEAEKKLLEKQAEGVDVTTALANLQKAKTKLAEVGTAFTGNDFEEAKKMSKEIKKEALFSERESEFKKDETHAIAEVMKKFTKVESKIARLVALGGDATTFNAQLATLRSDFDALQTSSTLTLDASKAFEKKADRLKNLVEQSIFALNGSGENGDLYSDHEQEAKDLEDDLNDVADVEDGDENGVSQKLRTIALEHKKSSQEVKKNLDDIQNRGTFARTLFGSDSNAVNGLENQVQAMNTRADALVKASEQVADPDMKQILTDRATALHSEVSKLQSYISTQASELGIFGRFLNLFR